MSQLEQEQKVNKSSLYIYIFKNCICYCLHIIYWAFLLICWTVISSHGWTQPSLWMFMLFDITFYAYLLPFSSANSFSQSLNVTLLMKGFAVVTPKKITANSLRTHRNCLSFWIVNHFQFSQGCGLSLLIFWLFLCLKTWTECCLTTWSWKWTHMNRWR